VGSLTACQQKGRIWWNPIYVCSQPSLFLCLLLLGLFLLLKCTCCCRLRGLLNGDDIELCCCCCCCGFCCSCTRLLSPGKACQAATSLPSCRSECSSSGRSSECGRQQQQQGCHCPVLLTVQDLPALHCRQQHQKEQQQQQQQLGEHLLELVQQLQGMMLRGW